MERGYVNTKGKIQWQVKQEIEKRFGDLVKGGVSVNFYGADDIDISTLEKSDLEKLEKKGFTVTKDGSIWINKSHVDSGKTVKQNR